MNKACLLFCMATVLMSCSRNGLSETASLPVVDGRVDETYGWSAGFEQATIFASRGNDGMLYLAIRAKTTGWVAIGTGSFRMDGARLFFGWTVDGESRFVEHVGVQNLHVEARDNIVTKWALVEENGVTSLELSLPFDRSPDRGRGDLRLMLALGDNDNPNTKHRMRSVFSVPYR